MLESCTQSAALCLISLPVVHSALCGFYFLLFHKFVSLLHLALSARGAHATSVSVISAAARCVVGGLLEFSVTDDGETRP